MRNVMVFSVIVALAAVFALAAGPALAQQSQGQASPQDVGKQAHDQATRGAANVITGWMDAPKHIVEESKEGEKNPLWPVTGAAKGAAAAVGRTAVGVGEIVTSPVPAKEPGIQPELFDPEDEVTKAE